MFSRFSLLVICLGLAAAAVNRATEKPSTDSAQQEHLRRADQGDPEEPDNIQDNNKSGDRGGATYVRWGRKVCPNTDTEMVYGGVAGGSYYAHAGGGANLICMTRQPQYQNYTSAFEKHGALYGAEYEAPKNYFSHRNAPVNKENGLQDQDVPCAVCRANTRISKIMIPGRKTCHGKGWTREYWGYLVTNYYGHAAQIQHVCMDSAPEGDPKGAPNSNGALLYVVQGVCGSLPCPPYINNWELTCVVCTK